MNSSNNVIIYNTRIEMIVSLIEKNMIIGEIGIFKGDFSKFLEKDLEPKQLHLFDLFSEPMCSGDQDGNNMSHTNMDEIYEELQKWSASLNKDIILYKGDSSTKLNTLEDNFFDMLYIDGDHSYEGCKKDLIAAFKKVKNAGYIMGHDYEMNMSKAKTNYSFGVKRAVDEFCQEYNQILCAKGIDGCVSYAIHLQK